MESYDNSLSCLRIPICFSGNSGEVIIAKTEDRRWANKPLNTFTEALEAFRTAMSYRFFQWLQQNRDVFFAFKQAFGLIWA